METIPILIPYGYRIDDADVKSAKEYILRREAAASALSSLINALLKDAAEEITRICYIYGVDPARFTLDGRYNSRMFDDVCRVLDKLEDDIMELMLDYATRCTEDEERKGQLMPWILLLGKGKRNLKQTLEGRIKMFAKDLEAMIAATAEAKYDMQKAVMRIKSSINAVYVMPEMKAAFAKATRIKAANIRTRGVKHGNTGSSNSEANNILRFAETTLQMTWMRNQLIDFKEHGAVGYYQFRGSNYNCDICDDATGFYPDIDEMLTKPLVHYHCLCYRVPVYDNNA